MKKMLICGSIVLVLSGCGAVVEEPIIAKKNEGYDVVQEESTAGTLLPELPLQQQIDAPERYQTTFQVQEGDYFSMAVNADASIVLPDVESMPVKKVQATTFDCEEYEQFKKLTETELGVRWSEERTQEHGGNSLYLTSNAAAGEREYQISYYRDKQDSPDYAVVSGMYVSMPIVYQQLSDYGELPEELQGQSQERNVSAAKALVEKVGGGEFQLVSEFWITGQRVLPDDSWGDDEYFYMLTFAPKPGAVPFTWISSTPKNKREIDQRVQFASPYVNLVYDRDGVLTAFYCMGKETIKEDYPINSFMLPFSDAAVIFESTLSRMAGSYAGITANQIISKEVNIQVDQVRLGYMSVYEKRGPLWLKNGQIIPVWDFFGTAEITYYQALDGQDVKNGRTVFRQELYNSPDTSLLTLNALDGTVVEREVVGIAKPYYR